MILQVSMMMYRSQDDRMPAQVSFALDDQNPMQGVLLRAMQDVLSGMSWAKADALAQAPQGPLGFQPKPAVSPIDG
ncbi:hypothetical protein CMI37_34905 [Candidatus Pacearchaeota archaeon]|nr:hypothetical protein [Candidatus Pacearchaeota archaeon]